jgi:hypothetical protein
MKNHILLDKAYIYPLPKTPLVPTGCIFDNEKGYWVINGSSDPLVQHKDYPILGTKKCDVETGEDRKSE